MAPYEALYERQCRTPLFWSQTGESQVFGPEVLKDAEKQVQMVRESSKVAQSRQKSYVDKRRRDLSSEVGEFLLIFLVQISKALVKSKIQFLIQKSFFFTFGPATLTGPLGLWPSRPPLASLLPQAEAHRPDQAAQPTHAVGVIAEVCFLL
jgi:hypothetical protein